MLCGLEREESGLVVCARVGDETQWLFAGKADAKSWNDAGTQLLRDGYAVIHGFLGANLALALREQARQKWAALILQTQVRGKIARWRFRTQRRSVV